MSDIEQIEVARLAKLRAKAVKQAIEDYQIFKDAYNSKMLELQSQGYTDGYQCGLLYVDNYIKGLNKAIDELQKIVNR